MNRRIYKKKKEQIIRYIGNDISQEQMIDIQAEAYYRALMKVEKEKNDKVNKKNEEKVLTLFRISSIIVNVLGEITLKDREMKNLGPLVKRSRHHPFTVVTGVRFP